MNFTEKKLVNLELEIPSLQTDQEGKLLGGFSSIPINGFDSTRSNGACHGCTINKGDCGCGDNDVCYGCVVNEKTCPPTTTTEANLGSTGSMSFSMLF